MTVRPSSFTLEIMTAGWIGAETERPPIDLLRPFPSEEMEAFEVSKDVGNVKNNSPDLLNAVLPSILEDSNFDTRKRGVLSSGLGQGSQFSR